MLKSTNLSQNIAVVIPAYKVTDHIMSVIAGIGAEVSIIYVVDDCCPDGSGDFVASQTTDLRVKIIKHLSNQGVGGAMITGYRAAIQDGAGIIVKIDGDGQMDPSLIPLFTSPIIQGEADYVKGNRFYDLSFLRNMPPLRIFGNSMLSFINKISSGYWDIFDPTNGYTAIHIAIARKLPLDKISSGYFFESDMLFRLNILRAVTVDVPMNAIYETEVSNISFSKIIGEFTYKHIRNFFKRVFYNYYLRDMSLASIELPLGVLGIIIGVIFGTSQWANSAEGLNYASAGTVMIAALPIIVGFNLILAFLGHDIASVPRIPKHKYFQQLHDILEKKS